MVVQLLHGICYAFFFATVYIFVDYAFPKDVRASAQGLYNLVIVGIGVIVGSELRVHVGGGIVADSDPADELAETETKVAGWTAALERLRR